MDDKTPKNAALTDIHYLPEEHNAQALSPAQKTTTGSRYRPYYSYAHDLSGEDGSKGESVSAGAAKTMPDASPAVDAADAAAAKPTPSGSAGPAGKTIRRGAVPSGAPAGKRRKGYGGVALIGLIVLVGLGIAFAGFFIEDTSPKIAVINIYGEMETGELPYGSGYAGSDTVCRLIRQAVDENCSAIILRINSGGGSGSCAEEINIEIGKAQSAGVPVVASIGDIGASAAYWVASQCDYVYVTNSSVTGSIGAIGIHTDYSRALEEEGISIEIFKSGDFKDMFYPYRNLTDDERVYWQRFVDNGADRFIKSVAEGRGLTVKEVEKLADGRVYSGEDAVYLKLADGVGNFYTAVSKAQELAGISNATLVYMDNGSSLLSYLVGYDFGNKTSPFETLAEKTTAAGKKTAVDIRYIV